MNPAMNAPASPRRPSATMRGVAWNRFLDLGRDDGGAVFVVTLALFFLMYLVCCGVYAVSTAVRERIQLQNACDAAVYSAAVVQADALSRIATINRAMAWTYVQMTRRQMDYIVLNWLDHTTKHYYADMKDAIDFNRTGSPCGFHQMPGLGWFIGAKPYWNPMEVRLNDRLNRSIAEVEAGAISSGSLNRGRIYDLTGALGGQFGEEAMSKVEKGVNEFSTIEGQIGQGSDAVDKIKDQIQSERDREKTSPDSDSLEGQSEQGVSGDVALDVSETRGISDEAEEMISDLGEETIKNVNGAVADVLNNLSKYPIVIGDGSLKNLIASDKNAIKDMNTAENSLLDGMCARIDAVAADVVKANVPSLLQNVCRYFIRQCDISSKNLGYFARLKNTKDDEMQFMSFADIYGTPFNVFGNGIDHWFVRGNGKHRTDGGDGIQRSYKHWAEASTHAHLRRPTGGASCRNDHRLDTDNKTPSTALVSDWAWWSIKWACVPEFGIHVPIGFARNCTHGHDDKCRSSGVPVYGRCYGDEPELYNDNFYVGEKALPLVLLENYFGKDGTITVGIVRGNQNVWERILGAIDGIFRAFDPDWTGDVKTSKTFVFASAKAGYVDKTDDRVADAQRIDYRIDWQTENQKWNLCQGNWDAVFVPVRMANSPAEDGKWQDADDRVLEDLISSATWRSLDGRRSSGMDEWQEISAPRLMNGVESERMYVDGFSAEQGRVELRYVTDGGKSKNLDWRGLSRVLYH